MHALSGARHWSMDASIVIVPRYAKHLAFVDVANPRLVDALI